MLKVPDSSLLYRIWTYVCSGTEQTFWILINVTLSYGREDLPGHFRDTWVIPYVTPTAKPILAHSYRAVPAALANPLGSRKSCSVQLHS